MCGDIWWGIGPLQQPSEFGHIWVAGLPLPDVGLIWFMSN